MNMDRPLVNRALFDAGQSPLTDADAAGNNAVYELCKSFFIQTFLEALSEVEWTGGRKREKLVTTGRPALEDRRYRFAYDMPFDCARPIELQNNEYFLVEDRLILTDEPRAELLYVSNGKLLREIASVSSGGPGAVHDMEYLSAGPPGTQPDVTLWPGTVADIQDGLPEDPEPAGDYPDYRLLDYEPKFYEYVEMALAAKLSMKLSDRLELHTTLLQKAMLLKEEARNASRAGRAAKLNGDAWWTERMGR